MSPRRSLALLTAAAFLSGVAAIAYELLWLRRLGEIVGSTSQALAVVLAVLFAGMGAGGRIVGSVADRRGGAIAVFVLLETILAASGLLFLPASRVLESAVASGGGFSVLGVAALLKSLGAGALVVLPAAAMGGTVAALARHVVRRSADLAPRVGRLYGWNTLGAAAAALAVPYVAIAKLGVAGSFAAAASCNLLAAALAYAGRVGRDTPAPVAIEPTRIAGGRRVVLAAAALSGFLAIALEIAWTRALAARTRGTVYSFATILFVYLLAIALGSLIAARLARRGLATRAAYAILLVATGLATLATTHALRADDDARRFGDALSAALAMGLPMCLLGANFPFLVALAHRELGAVGREVGRVALFNSAGSAVAAIAATHVLLPWLGIETTIAAAAWAFVLGGSLFVLPWANVSRGAERSIQASTIVAALALTCLLPDDLRRWRAADGDRLLHYEEGVSASVAVVAQGPSDVVLKVDGDYRLGSTRTQFAQERQGLIPLLLHPEPSRVLMLGVGTGCSTGAVARYGNLAIDAAEILPEVLRALPGFDSINGSLLRRAQQDVKVRLLAADARVLVRAPGPPYDVAIGDLYVPWRAGEGAMYTREHFEAVRDRLATGGLFCQWLPLYQLGLGELRTVVATFAEVFPNVSTWWLYFNVEQPAIGLVGSREPLTLDLAAMDRRRAAALRRTLFGEAGIDEASEVLASRVVGDSTLRAWAHGADLETRDRPRVEFRAPLDGGRGDTARAAENVDVLLAMSEVDDGDPQAGRRRAALRLTLRGLWLSAHAHEHAKASAAFDAALELAPDWRWVRSCVDAAASRPASRTSDSGH